MIAVRFPAGEKRFVYPDAFSEHLSFADAGIQHAVTGLIAEREKALARQRRLEQARQERRHRLLHYPVTANSHAAFDVAPEDAERVCETFAVSAGRYLSGPSRGKPKTPEKLKPNSVCLLTERPAGEDEGARRILGAFMVRADYFGEDSDTGIVESHPEHRMLAAGEPLLFWDYFSREGAPRWGKTAFRYCSAAAVNRILSDLVRALEGTDQRGKARAFYRYFRRVNHLRLPAGTREGAPDAAKRQ